jgi:hypothetical protein
MFTTTIMYSMWLSCIPGAGYIWIFYADLTTTPEMMLWTRGVIPMALNLV